VAEVTQSIRNAIDDIALSARNRFIGPAITNLGVGSSRTAQSSQSRTAQRKDSATLQSSRLSLTYAGAFPWFDPANMQSLCKQHHSVKTHYEMYGKSFDAYLLRGCNVDGSPKNKNVVK
jgi:hypothetical protein